LIGAAGTVISAWLVARVRKVQSTVNGHTARLEAKIERLELALRRQRSLSD